MAKFWLMPVQWDGSYAVLGEERLLLEPEQARIRFVEALRPVHPRLLLSFKAELLLADEALEACGTDALPFDLGQGQPIRLAAGEQKGQEPEQGEDYPLSHCAEAYFNRLMTPQELYPAVANGRRQGSGAVVGDNAAMAGAGPLRHFAERGLKAF